jgi:hypothetical protein
VELVSRKLSRNIKFLLLEVDLVVRYVEVEVENVQEVLNLSFVLAGGSNAFVEVNREALSLCLV